MKTLSSRKGFSLGVALIAMLCALGSYASSANATDVMVKLSGDQEVPPVGGMGSGSGTITVGADKSVSGTVTTNGISGAAAHIHTGAAGKNGPVIIPLIKSSDNTWMVPAGAKLTDAQYAAFKAGDLYVNVHTKEHPNGELRGQLKP